MLRDGVKRLREALEDIMDDCGAGETPEHWCIGEGCHSCKIWNEARAALEAKGVEV